MKKFIATALFLLFIASLTGCSQTATQLEKEWQAETGGGLKRTVTMYSYSGEPIRAWEGDNIIINGTEGSETEFIIDGKKVSVSGSFVIEEN